jgi:quinoprotein glucose dehydrogenase
MARVGLGTVVLQAAVLAVASAQAPGSVWRYYGGDKAFTRYAALDQIDAGNVAQLRVVWSRSAVDPQIVEDFPGLNVGHYLDATPIYIDGVLYAPNAHGLVDAFDPATGQTLWTQEPVQRTEDEIRGGSTRGLDYWTSPSGGDRVLAVRGEYLYALDPRTGDMIRDFGDQGRVGLRLPGADRFSWSSGPIVVDDIIVIAGNADGAGDGGARWRGSVSEDVRGYDVRTGRQLWIFHLVPRPGEFGYDTWGGGSALESGDLGSWCCLSGDDELGLVYVPTTAPTSAYYGGHRPGDNLFSNSLVALDVRTGRRAWHFQMVHHDLWEYDTVGAPILGEITVDGERIPAVMQPSKTGFLYVFNRETGKPVWPIEERLVPTSSVPGEVASRTQPFPTKPPPFAQQGYEPIDLSPELKAAALDLMAPFVTGPIFTPPSVVSDEPGGTKGTLMLPGAWGAGNWNTGAFDPEMAMYYAVSHSSPTVYGMVWATAPESEMTYVRGTAEDVPDPRTYQGLPTSKPPWGRLTAINMNEGEIAWQRAIGPGPRQVPALDGLANVPDLGFANRPAPLVTRSLLFLGEGSDAVMGIPDGMWGRGFRAYDKATGEVLWEIELPGGTTGAPMTYMHQGKQYVVVPTASRAEAPRWVALALE